jgi:hypothetical protein
MAYYAGKRSTFSAVATIAHCAIDGYSSAMAHELRVVEQLGESTDWQHFGSQGHVAPVKRACCPNASTCQDVGRGSRNAKTSKTRQVVEQTWLLARKKQIAVAILHARCAPSQNGQVFARAHRVQSRADGTRKTRT